MKEKNSKIETAKAKAVFNGGIIAAMIGVIIGAIMGLSGAPFEIPYILITFVPMGGGIFTMIIGGAMIIFD